MDGEYHCAKLGEKDQGSSIEAISTTITNKH